MRLHQDAVPSRLSKPQLLIDTNVWLDYYLGPLRSGFPAASELIRYAVGQGVGLLYAVQSLRDVYLQIRLVYKRRFREEFGELDQASVLTIHQTAWSYCENLCELATAVGADESDVWLARKYHAIHPDFEDDFIIAAMLRSGADYLVTNDQALLKNAPVAALSPANLLTLLKAMET